MTTLDTLTSRNPLHVSGALVYIEMRNTPLPTFATASIEDLERVAMKRWRYIGGQVVTTTMEPGYEASLPLPNYITGQGRNVTLILKNSATLDCRRDNILGFTKSRTPNTITLQGDVATIHTAAGDVLIDADMVPKVKPYTWIIKQGYSGRLNIQAQTVSGKGNQKLLYLTSLIANVKSPQNYAPITHANGERLDCRRSNLVVTLRKANVSS